jgi:hygromycin-B 7''-O-kinase
VLQRPTFDSVSAYGQRFTDVALWQPYVAEVCRGHGLETRGGIHSCLPGTHPVFRVGDRCIVKFFTDLFAGAQSFAIEREVYSLLEQVDDFPAPRLVGEGALFPPDEGWHWPYLVSTVLPGISLGEVYDQVGSTDREEIARYLGGWLKRLHSVRLNTAGTLRPDSEPFTDWLEQQRASCVESHQCWQGIPGRLIEQLDDYLPTVDVLLDRSTWPLLLHCDLNADHLLGQFQNGRWISSGIIDFGDAKVGDFVYELVALHLGLFRSDKSLLRIFLEAYGSECLSQPEFPARAMSFTLLHEFNVLESIFEFFPALDRVPTVAGLADWLWNLETPSPRLIRE